MEQPIPTLPENQKKFKSIIIVSLTLGAILLAFLLLGNVYLLKKIRGIEMDVMRHNQNIQSKFVQIEQDDVTSKEQLSQLTQQVSQLQKIMATSKLKTSPEQQWSLIEIAHLLNLANLNLHYNHNVSETISLIQLILDKLKDARDPTQKIIYQQLSESLNSLKKIPSIDQNELLTKLMTLLNQVNSLPQLTQIPSPETEKPIQQEGAFRQALQNSWQALQKIIIIRRVNDPLPLPLLPSQKQLLVQNIQLLLIQTQWAVLQRDPFLYKSNLEQVKLTIKNYFDLKQSFTQQFLATVEKLQIINIKPKLPDLTDTIHLLDSTLQRQHQE